MNLRRHGRAAAEARRPPARAYVDNYYPFRARPFGLSCAFTCDHRKRGGGKPRSGGAAHHQGQGQGQGYGQKWMVLLVYNEHIFIFYENR